MYNRQLTCAVNVKSPGLTGRRRGLRLSKANLGSNKHKKNLIIVLSRFAVKIRSPSPFLLEK
jgi:hypothetical protein